MMEHKGLHEEHNVVAVVVLGVLCAPKSRIEFPTVQECDARGAQ